MSYSLDQSARRIGVSRAGLVDLLDAGEATATTVQTGRGSGRRLSEAEVERLRQVRVDALHEALADEWDVERGID